MDQDSTIWQKVGNELRLPPGTDYLMRRIGMSDETKSSNKRRDHFAGHVSPVRSTSLASSINLVPTVLAAFVQANEPLTADMLNADSTLKKELFAPDNIHLSQDGGYGLDAEKLKPLVETLVRMP